MGITPWVVGQTDPAWTISMVRDNGAIMDLTGVTAGQLSLLIYNAFRQPAGTGAGTFTIVQAKPGIVQYQVDAADVATAGIWYIRVKVNFNGTNPDMSDYILWQVQI